MDSISSYETPAEAATPTFGSAAGDASGFGAPRTARDDGAGADKAAETGYGGWDSAGRLLQAARDRIGYDLADISDALKIRFDYLQAIEEGRYETLPGTAYALGFIRSYAAFVGLDAGAVVRLYKTEIAETVAPQSYYLPTPKAETRVPGGLMLLVSLIAGSLAYGGWYYVSSNLPGSLDLIPPVPDRLAALVDETGPGVDGLGLPRAARDQADLARTLPLSLLPGDPDEPRRGSETIPLAALPDDIARTLLELEQGTAAHLAATEGDATTDGRQAGSTTEGNTATGETDPDAPPGASETANRSIVAAVPDNSLNEVVIRPKPGEEPGDDRASAGRVADGTEESGVAPGQATQAAALEHVYGQQHDRSRILLKAVAESWIQLRDSSGRQLFQRLLQPGEAYRVPNRPGVRLKVGNAGGLVVQVDDVDLAPLGASGQVVRNVVMDPVQLRERLGASIAN